MYDISIKKILVPTDLSEPAEYALAYAKKLAAAFDAKLYVLYCITDLQSAIGYVPGLSLDQITSSMTEEAEKQIEHLKNKYKLDDNVEISIESGDAAKRIVEFIDKNDIDLIVMGAHGKSGIERFMFGSVTEKVMRLSKKPVLATKK